MLTFHVIRKCTNAQDRKQDRWYRKTIKLPFCPEVGWTIWTGGKNFEVIGGKVFDDNHVAVIEVKGDHRTFKCTPFQKVCDEMLAAGFTEIPESRKYMLGESE